MTSPVITRFAPSPTGFLHIGGARTALFNWLYAKANNGKMLLRIEDTDRERSNDAAVEAILDGLSWLGLEWDGEPISQFSRVERHREVAHQLLATGGAYRCYCTPEELQAMRETAKAEGRNPVYDGTWRDKDPSLAPQGAPFVVRLKTPLDGGTILDDQVQGQVSFPNKDLDDFVLLRSDGTPTYMLAVVVDDHDMGVTHIIRGDDHLTNAAKQSLIYRALDWNIPVLAHIPLIHGADGAKLSKRHGAIGAEAYRAMGYLPEAMRNYLVRLGWSHGDDEIFSTDQMIEWFGFDGMNKSAARFDFAKLESINAAYLRDYDDDALMSAMTRLLDEMDGGEQIKTLLTPEKTELLRAMIPTLKGRGKTLLDVWENAKFTYADRPLALDDKASALLDESGKKVVSDLLPQLEAVQNWDHDAIDTVLKNYCEKHELKLGKVAQPVRAALTGQASSPGAYDVLLGLGKEESLARIRDLV